MIFFIIVSYYFKILLVLAKAIQRLIVQSPVKLILG